MIAEVILSMGRQHLIVHGVCVATEGDISRDPMYPRFWDEKALEDAASLINEKRWSNWKERFNEPRTQ